MLSDLEDKFGEFAFNLLSFTKDEQEDILMKMLEKELNVPNEINKEKLRMYAEELIKVTGNLINDNELEFTGIPLQIKMLGEVYEKHFEKFYNSSETEPELSENLDLIDLHEHFLKYKCEVFYFGKNNLDISKPELISQFESNYLKFIKQHQYMAVCTLFKEETVKKLAQENHFKDMKKKISSDINDIKEGKLNKGIIDEIIGDKPHFIHQTFAEYLVAQFLVTTLENETAVVSELYRILIDLDNQGIGIFFNGLWGKVKLSNNILKMSGECIEKLWKKNPQNLCYKNHYTLLHPEKGICLL